MGWRSRVTSVLAVVLFIVALVAAVLVYRQNDPVRDAGATPGYSDSPLASALGPSAAPGSRTLIPDNAPSSNASPVLENSTIRTVFLGDDYTVGVGASSESKSWTSLLAKSLGLSPVIVGDRGCGYARQSASGKTYASLVAQVVAANPDLVVVSGGRNDVSDDMSTLKTAAMVLFSDLHEQLPDASLIGVAPWWGDSSHPAELIPIDAAVKSAVRAVGGTYINPGDPLVGHSGWMADEADPNDQGYKAIADSVAPAIAAHLPR